MLLIAILADRDPASNIFILSERFEFTCLGFPLPAARFFSRVGFTRSVRRLVRLGRFHRRRRAKLETSAALAIRRTLFNRRPIERTAMITVRAAFTMLTLTALAAIGARSASAEIYRPWCVQYQSGSGNGAGPTCAFTSFEQCMMTAGPGTGAFCVENPWYLAYGEGRKPVPARGERSR
jgi:Protein of unknown function (DUF3551)